MAGWAAPRARLLLAALLLSLSALAPAQRVELAAGAIDPDRPEPRLQSEIAKAVATPLAPGESRLALVQWDSPITPDKLAVLADRGVVAIEYIPENAYLVAVPQGVDLNGLVRKQAGDRTQPRWSAPLLAEWKARPGTFDGPSSPSTESEKSAAIRRRGWYVQVADVGNLKATVEQIKQRSRSASPFARFPYYETWLVGASAEEAAALTQLNSVLWIEPVNPITTSGERGALVGANRLNAAGTCVVGAGGGYQEWLDELGFAGDGYIVQVTDDGLSQGDFSNLPGTAHPDLLGRIAGIDNPTADPLGNSTGGHGHINASIIMGQPLAGGGRVDKDGFLLGQGVVPGAQVFATKIFNNHGGSILDELINGLPARSPDSLTKVAYDNGARISSNSWGISMPLFGGQYDQITQIYDRLTRDCNALASGQQPMIFFFAAGNFGPLARSIASPAAGKNIISVGASENCDQGEFDRSGIGPSLSDNLQDIAVFSSRGPTADDRIAPTIVAPGTHITGAASDDPNFDGHGVSGRLQVEFGEPPENVKYYPAFQTDYTWSSGTSHSTPLAAGAAVLLYEYFLRTFGIEPSPAMVKAALIATASDMSAGGLNDGSGLPVGPSPNPDAGWGRLNIDRLVHPSTMQFAYDQQTILTSPGQGYDTIIQVTDGNQPLRIVLAWTDPPASLLGQGSKLVNDLDLRVVDPLNRSFLGNVFEGGVSVEGGIRDTINNVEVIHIPRPVTGIYRVVVQAATLKGDALPNQGGPLEQDFALFVTNGANQTSRGRIAMLDELYGCDDTVEVRLSDSDLIGEGTAEATISSQLTQDEETVVLFEVNAPSGVLDGAIQTDGALSPKPGDGVLTVRHGDTITVRYSEQSAEGEPFVSEDTAVVDCEGALLISQEVFDVTATTARVRVTLNEPANVTIGYGLSCGELNRLSVSPTFGTVHELNLEGLPPCSPVFFNIRATDEAGNSRTFDHNGQCYAFVTDNQQSVTLFNDNVPSEFTPHWTHGRNFGFDDWDIFENDFAVSNGLSWGSIARATINDSFLTMPPLFILPETTLTFWHTFRLESLGPGAAADGAMIEISLDGGTIWGDLGTYIQGAQGYNSTIVAGTGNPLVDRRCWSNGTLGPMEQVTVDLSDFAGETALIRFRLATDSGNTLEAGDVAAWYIDQVTLVSTEPAECVGTLAVLEFDARFISCNKPALRFTITDADLSLANGGIPTTFRLGSSVHPDTVQVFPDNLALIDPKGIWEGFLSLEPGILPNTLRVAGLIDVPEGARVRLSYRDSNVSGSPYVVEDEAPIDCTAPALFSAEPVLIEPNTAVLRIISNEENRVVIHFGTSCDNLNRTETRELIATEIYIGLHDLLPCTPYYYKVELIDRAGESEIFDNFGNCFGFVTSESGSLRDTLEPNPQFQWQTQALAGTNDWTVTFYGQAHSPIHTWFSTNASTTKDVVLVTPPVDITPETMLRFYHTYALEAGFDGAVIEISTDGGATWEDLGNQVTQGFYNGVISTQFGSRIAGRRAWTGGQLGLMQPVTVALARYAGEDRRVRFRLVCDTSQAVKGGGWHIDDVEFAFERACPLQFPAPPVLVSPPDDLRNVSFDDSIVLDWNSAAFAESYIVRWGTTFETLNTLVDTTNTETWFPFTGITSGQTIYWRILARNALGVTSSAVRRFTMEVIDPNLVAKEMVGMDSGASENVKQAMDINRDGKISVEDVIQGVNLRSIR